MFVVTAGRVEVLVDVCCCDCRKSGGVGGCVLSLQEEWNCWGMCVVVTAGRGLRQRDQY